MRRALRRIAAYLGFGSPWQVVLITTEGDRQVVARHWDERHAEFDAELRDLAAHVSTWRGGEHPGRFTYERIRF